MEEAFKFIPREQIVVTRTEDYAKSEVRKNNLLKFGNLCRVVGVVLFYVIVALLKIIVAKSVVFIYPWNQEAKYHRTFVPSQMARRYMVHT
mgnify:CR=1 FL=1